MPKPRMVPRMRGSVGKQYAKKRRMAASGATQDDSQRQPAAPQPRGSVALHAKKRRMAASGATQDGSQRQPAAPQPPPERKESVRSQVAAALALSRQNTAAPRPRARLVSAACARARSQRRSRSPPRRSPEAKLRPRRRQRRLREGEGESMAASGASDDPGDRLARKRQPAAPQEEESIASSVSSGAPNYDDADYEEESIEPSVSSGAEEESMRSRSPRSEPQASGSGQKRQPAAPQPERQPAAPQPGAATEVVQVDVPDRIEYHSAADRPLLNAFIGEWPLMNNAEDLEGHDVAAMMLAWSTEAAASGATGGTVARARGPAETVCLKIMQQHSEHKRLWKESDPSIASHSISERSLRRAETTNWKRGDSSTRHQLKKAEIEAIMKSHEGEARLWQTEPECWVPLVDEGILASGLAGMGQDQAGTYVRRTSAARGAEFSLMARPTFWGKLRDVVDFGPYLTASPQPEGGPNLDDAVSTLVVRAFPSSREGAPEYWLRKVWVITLAEVLNNFKDDEAFEIIYQAWAEGPVVIRARPPRGVAAGRARR